MLGDLWSFQGRYRTLHLTWIAFFLTFVVWFNLAPLATTVKADLGLTVGQIRTVAICNVALTIPARVLIGMLLDKFGPRITYSSILVSPSFPACCSHPPRISISWWWPVCCSPSLVPAS